MKKTFLQLVAIFIAITSYSQSYFNATPSIGSNGLMEIGRYLDFHELDNDPADYSLRLISSNNGLYLNSKYPSITGSGTNYFKQFSVNEPRYNIPVGVIDNGYRIGLAV